MRFDRQQELISGEAVGCHGDRAAHQGCPCSPRSHQKVSNRESLPCSGITPLLQENTPAAACSQLLRQGKN